MSRFKVKVKYTKQLENGAFKRVTEPYIVPALSFTDAEATIYEELGSIIRGEFVVMAIERAELQDIFQYEDSDVWYEVGVKMETESEEGGKSKAVTQKFLVTANTTAEACVRIAEELKSLMVDYKIISSKETPIVEVFAHKEKED